MPSRIAAAVCAPFYLFFAIYFGLAGAGLASIPHSPYAMAAATIGLLATGVHAITFAFTGNRG